MRKIEMIAVDKIRVVNPRTRNRRTHLEIIENIKKIGLKRPITVNPRRERDGNGYDLVCGQGRLEAFQHLGYAEIPAFVVSASKEDCLVMSLVENVARRHRSGAELMKEIGSLSERGYSDEQIAEKLGVTTSWVGMVVGLLRKGEERLISAVESGLIPISLAVTISRSDDAGIQEALADAYAQGGIKGKKIGVLKRLLEQRSLRGGLERKSIRGRHSPRKITSAQLVKTLEREVARNKVLAKKAEFTHGVLSFIVEAMKDLSKDRGFVDLVKAEGIGTLPRLLETRMEGGRQ